MSLADYDGLKAAITTYTGRSSFATGLKDDLIDQAEAYLNRKLRVAEMEASTTLSVSSNPVALPSDFLEIANIELASDPKDLQRASRQFVSQTYAGSNTGRPKMYTLTPGAGTSLNPPKISFYPAPDSTYTANLDYFQRLPALSDSTTSNWLLLKAPDVYLQAVLYHYFVYTRDQKAAIAAKAILDEMIADLNAENQRRSYSEPGLVIRNSTKGP